MVRKKSQQEQFEQQHIKTVLADLEGDVSHVVKDIDKIIFAAGSGGKNVLAVDEEGAKKLIDAGKKEKVKKFIMLSSMGVDNPEESDNLQAYFQAKQNADTYLRESNITYSIVRPGALTNEIGKGKIEFAKKLNRSGEISRDDVAQTLVSVLHDSAAVNETFEILKGETLIADAIPN
jgi:uncharacterized protein YbjT (DUF2867 family)